MIHLSLTRIFSFYSGTNGRNTALFPRWKHNWCFIWSMTEGWLPSVFFPCLLCYVFRWWRPLRKFWSVLDYKFTQLKGNQKFRYYFKITDSVGNFGSKMRRCCRENTPLILTLDDEYVKTLKYTFERNEYGKSSPETGIVSRSEPWTRKWISWQLTWHKIVTSNGYLHLFWWNL